MNPAPVIGVLALQGAVAEHQRALHAVGATTRLVRRPAELENLDGLVVPGGESTAMARLAASTNLMPAIREHHEQGMAVFGTCAGLILLANDVADEAGLQGFDRIGGLDVAVRRNAYGAQLDSFEEQLEVRGLEAPMTAVFIRAPIIEQVLSDDVEVLAEARGTAAAVCQGNLVATSFHPELTEDTGLHRLFAEIAESRRSRRRPALSP
ncbi:pyridoxal 5'-phosphate synthase glutaminase subunit PdxT [Garicola koreensis]|uniref:Pyridoxal 5'-phosphate synthase subunit PdxT n=1 Tax=Garicola koreensis TaxID=1262554 RepID=A0A7W5TQC0_9MICC|nr:5'-phosphate synthase pdxT subunit [Garicola koreensis]